LVQFYALLKLVPDELEFISATRFEVGSGRADWAAPTLARANGKWDVVVPVAPPTPPPTDEWVCTVCEHVYNATADGGGLPFEKLPDTWKCPVRPPPPHTHTHARTLSLSHAHIMHGAWLRFTAFRLQVCGQPKSVYTKRVTKDGAVEWVHS
jgi:hypothetical protein